MVERNCPTCNQKIEVEVGLHNAKNLFKWPSFQDWILLFIIALVLVGAYTYDSETQACRDMLNELNDFPQIEIEIDYDALQLNGIEIPPQEVQG